MSKMKVLLVTEYINPPYDEGIKKTVYQLYKTLMNNFEVKVICKYGFQGNNILELKTNRLYISRQIKKEINLFEPNILIYLPFSSTTFASFIRHFILSKYKNSAKTILIAMQPKPIKAWQKKIVKLIKPQIVLTPSPQLQLMLDALGINNKLLPLFTELNKFTPINNLEYKFLLRKKYNIPLNTFVISHMGHLNEGRNLKTLIPLQKKGYQIVIVSSSSTPIDSKGPLSLKQELIENGIIIIDQYIKNIEEIYQLSDCYIFPVINPNSSIGLPLSILEARACGIPVITTDYGSVKYFLYDDFGAIYYSTTENFINTANFVLNSKKSDFKKSHVSSLNELFFRTITETFYN